MLFMQPIKLHHMFSSWGLEDDPSIWQIRHRLRTGDPVVRNLIRGIATLLLVAMPALAVASLGLLEITGVHARWSGVALGVAAGVVVGVVGSTAYSLAYGIAYGLTGGVALCVTAGLMFGATIDVVIGLAFGMAFGVARVVAGGVAGGASRFATGSVVLDMATGTVFGAAIGMMSGVASGVTGGVASILISWRLPLYFCEASWVFGSLTVARAFPSLRIPLSRVLPIRYHDIIRFPLPGLRAFLVDLADHDTALARQLIDEASATIAQKIPARRALAEVQSKSLSRAARDRLWMKTAALDLPFLPKPEDIPEASPLLRFAAAAQDLHARLTTDHLRRRQALARARATLASFRIALLAKRRPDDLERFLLPTSGLWLDVIDDELRSLAEDERAHPQIPSPFEPGSTLRSDDAHLFKGRTDLVRLIDHDLADHRRAPLLLTGQRRMGKTSLLGMLPERLGTGTRVITLNFQSLSGHSHREHPHIWLAEAIAKVHPDLPAPPTTTAWADTLTWLKDADATLGKTRILVAIDEIERVQTGIEEGWTTPAFLDFLRAAGDSLRNVRLLLVSAHPLHRLGRAWTDRLISVVHREIGCLLPDEAADLALHPMPGFPDIYPEGGVDRIVRETNGHPYLVQLVCDALIRDLNGRSLLKATDADLTRALDRALGDTPLFRELWQDRTDDERALLRRLAAEGDLALDPDAALHALLHEGYVDRAGDRYRIAVPLFRTWIRERA
jgi:hypothetical protein